MARKRGQTGVAANGPANAGSGNDTAASLRVIGLIATAIGLLALTALACVESYPSLHALAGQAAVSPALARYYPLIFDAMLLIAGSSVLALRGAGLLSRVYAWLSLFIALAGLAAGGVVHAAGVAVPRRPAEIAAAAIPWALVLIAFGLLFALLRYAKRGRSASRPALAGGQPEPPQAGSGDDLGESAADATSPDAAAEHAATGQAQPARPLARPADLQLRARVPASRSASASELAPHEVTTPADATAPGTATTKPNRRPQPESEASDPAVQATDDTAELASRTVEASEAGDPAAEPPEFRRPHGSPTPPDG